MHYEYRVVINATNGKDLREFAVETADSKPFTKYRDALIARENKVREIAAYGWHPLSTVIQSRRVEDWGRTTYPAELGLDTGKLINDNQLMAQRLDAIEAQCARERANIDNIKPAARNADFLLGELSNFTRHIHLTADAEGGAVAFYAGHPEYNAEFVAVWWCLLSIIRRKDADRLRATLRKSLDSWGECADALRVSIALKQRLILRVVSLKGAVARASKARKADKAKLRRVREIADQMAHNDKVCDVFDAKCHGWVKELLEVTK